MKRLLQKIIDMLLKKTEHLTQDLEQTQETNDPMQKKINELLARKEMMKSALNQANQKPKD